VRLLAASWAASADDVFGIIARMKRKEFNCAGNAFGGCLGGVDVVAVTVLGGLAKVPADNAVC